MSYNVAAWVEPTLVRLCIGSALTNAPSPGLGHPFSSYGLVLTLKSGCSMQGQRVRARSSCPTPPSPSPRIESERWPIVTGMRGEETTSFRFTPGAAVAVLPCPGLQSV